MSIHLLQCAAETKIDGHFTATHKLALMCFGDSGSEPSRITRPGHNMLQIWTCAERSWIGEVVKDLIELQLLTSHRKPCRGRVAEYVVFPNGCCEKHGLVPADVRPPVIDEVLTLDSEQLAKATGIAVPLVSGRFADLSVPTGSIHLSTATAPGAVPELSTATGDGTGMQPVATPECNRWPRSIPARSLKAPPEVTTPRGELTGPLTSRDPQVDPGPTLDFSEVDVLPWTQPPPSAPGEPCPNPSCNTGDILDRNLEPIAKCPICRPAVAVLGRDVIA